MVFASVECIWLLSGASSSQDQEILIMKWFQEVQELSNEFTIIPMQFCQAPTGSDGVIMKMQGQIVYQGSFVLMAQVHVLAVKEESTP